jgi:hypothetical protein
MLLLTAPVPPPLVVELPDFRLMVGRSGHRECAPMPPTVVRDARCS